MTAAELKALLAVHAQTAADPVLTTGELDVIVAGAARADADERAPSDAEWDDTYDLVWAVIACWETKAAKAVGRVQFSRNGMTVARQQLREACLAQARLWRRRRGLGAIPVGDSAGGLALQPWQVANGPDYLADEGWAGGLTFPRDPGTLVP